MPFDRDDILSRRKFDFLSSKNDVTGPPPAEPRAFETDAELLDAARQMFGVRSALRRVRDEYAKTGSEKEVELAQWADAWKNHWHRSRRLDATRGKIVERCRNLDLDETDWEILVMVLLNDIGFGLCYRSTCTEVIQELGLPGTLANLERFTRNARLVAAGLIRFTDTDERLASQTVKPDRDLVAAVLEPFEGGADAFEVENEKEFFGKIKRLSSVLGLMVESHAFRFDYAPPSLRRRHVRKAKRVMETADRTLEQNPGWEISKIFEDQEVFDEAGRLMMMVLLGKELGHLSADHDLYTGKGLGEAVRAVQHPDEDDDDTERDEEELLDANHDLIRQDWIQPCGGLGNLLQGDSWTLEDVEFELTDKSLEKLGIERVVLKRRSEDNRLQRPNTRLKNLVLSPEVERGLSMALAHARNQGLFVDEWGLSEIIPYGRAVTLLFTGPPGVGKTASAQAVAAELERPILVVNYSELMNCFVGQTEKNISKTFRDARRAGAVLFWDEADAMFFDRGSSQYNWEAREVNVLLQEIERFEGVCVLATNRPVVLDQALARRITLKIEFEEPDLASRAAIWRIMLPDRLPLGPGVAPETLAHAELTGGEIKNVILNACRIAVMRDRSGPVTLSDFSEAIRMEMGAKESREGGKKVGF